VETWKTNGLSSYISPEKCRYQVFSNLNFIHPKNENQIGMFNDFHKMGFVIRNIWDIRIIIRSSWIIMIIPKLFFFESRVSGVPHVDKLWKWPCGHGEIRMCHIFLSSIRSLSPCFWIWFKFQLL
jgi:hypothetical protein